MAAKQSAGLLLYRLHNKVPEVLLVHPGGPFWRKKDTGAWSIPKGEFTDDEDAFDAARREFLEETGMEVSGKYLPLTPIKQKGHKQVYAWALEADIDADKIKSNYFEIEWPPSSGKKQQFPEIDKAAWFGITQAKEKINPSQAALLDELIRKLEL